MNFGREGVRMSRREWTALVGTAVGQVTQKTPPEGAPKPAPATATPAQRMQKAMADVKEVSDRLQQLEVPMNIEPAFAFRP